MTNLWRFNKITGYWVLMRSCTEETKNDWLEIFQSDAPNEKFKLSKNKPR